MGLFGFGKKEEKKEKTPEELQKEQEARERKEKREYELWVAQNPIYCPTTGNRYNRETKPILTDYGCANKNCGIQTDAGDLDDWLDINAPKRAENALYVKELLDDVAILIGKMAQCQLGMDDDLTETKTDVKEIKEMVASLVNRQYKLEKKIEELEAEKKADKEVEPSPSLER